MTTDPTAHVTIDPNDPVTPPDPADEPTAYDPDDDDDDEEW